MGWPWSSIARMSGNLASDIGSGVSSASRGIGGSVFGLARNVVAQAPAAISAYRGGGGFPIPPLGGGSPTGFEQVGSMARGGGIGGLAGVAFDMFGGVLTNVPTQGGYGGGQMQTVAATPQGTAAIGAISQLSKGMPMLPDDINSLIALRNAGFILRNADLINTPRSPNKNFVVVRPWNDLRTIGMRRDLAIKYGLFKPARKPLISVRQTSALRDANGAIKALKRANKVAKRIANFNPGGSRKALPPPKKGR